VNLFEEVGDIFWYLAIMADEIGFSFEDVMDRNLEKLKAKYDGKFTADKAINRNLEKELEVLK
jgi:NTP pyrophosphatase (non-canonical NTP hydrolase)